MAKDPICGMNVDESKAAGTAVYKGKTYYFCSSGCKAKFEKEPEKYAASGARFVMGSFGSSYEVPVQVSGLRHS